MKITELNRCQAFASHLAISLLIFFIILICITQYWYPGILFDTGNAWKAIGLIIGIDLILGPLLTLIIFNPKKSSLKTDLSIIAIIQITALAYGIWTIHSSHPLAIAFINNSFITFYANAENAELIEEKVNSLKSNQLYYVFDDNNPSEKIEADQLFRYSDNSKSVTLIQTPYIIESMNRNELLIHVDPLASKDRYIVVNKSSGSIIKFTNSLTESRETN